MKTQSMARAVAPVIMGVILTLGATMPLYAGIKQNVENFLYEKKAFGVVQDYADKAVIKTLEQLTAAIGRLNHAAAALEKNNTDKAMAEAAKAWHEAMAQFNVAWIFNYGPAAHYDFHKQLATWPFDKVIVDDYLARITAGKISVDSLSLRMNKHASTRGLYTVQYLLFDDGRVKKAAQMTPAHITYLSAVCQALLEEGIDFEAAWKGTKNLSQDKQAVLSRAGLKPRSSYAWEFKNPGEADSRYVSVSIPLQEIFQESTSVLEDMLPIVEGLVKPFDPAALSYWESLDPFADALNMLQGVEDAYYGGVEGERGASLSDLVAEKDAVLDRRVKTAFAHVFHRIKALRDLGADVPEAQRELMVRIAVAETEKLTARLTAATPIVTADQALSPWAAYGK